VPTLRDYKVILEPGQKFGSLTFIERLPTDGAWGDIAKWSCDCGEVVSRRITHVRKGTISSCGCALGNGMTNHDFFILHQFKVYQRGAKVRGLDFSLTLERFEVLVDGVCAYCGCPPSTEYSPTFRSYGWRKKPRAAKPGNKPRKISLPKDTVWLNGVDRVDNSIGYTVENSVSCCAMCNRMKHAYGAAAFIEKCRAIANHQLPTVST